MPYIGNTAADRFVASKAASVFSGDGSTTAFTLSYGVGSDEDILVSVDGVIQEPSVAYSVSGTTLTFTAAPSSNAGNNIFVYYLFRTVGTVSHPSSNALEATSGTFTGDLTVDTSTLKVDSTNNRVGINVSSPTVALDVASADDNQIQIANTGGGAAFIGIDSSNVLNIGRAGPVDIAFQTNSAERMRILSNGNVDVKSSGDATLKITAGGTSNDSKIDFVHGTTTDGGITYDHNGAYASEKMAFRAGNNGTHMYLMGDGNFFLGKTNTSSSVEGVRLHSGVNHHITVNGANVILFNRGTNDGQIVGFASQDATQGNISISGSTTSYNAFSASHWSRLTDNSKPTILKGTVIETIDEMCDWYQITFTVPATDDTPEHNPKISIALEDGQSVGDTITYNHDGTDYQATIIQEDDNKHTKCKISDTADSTRVYGVFADWDNDDDTVNDMYVTAVGTHVVRVHSSATVSAGDLLVSNGDGTAKVQDDDIIRSKTIGKVLTNIKQETYDDGSYTVPCALYCG